MQDIRLLVPQNKHDIGRADKAIAADYPKVAPILPDLLLWLQDYNWPVAHVLAPFLASIGSPLIPHIHVIWNSDDEIWRYWVIVVIMRESREICEAFREELECLAYSPTPDEVTEELSEEAQLALRKYGWHRFE